MSSLGRKLKFGLGLLLAIWPVAVAAFVPAQYFAGFDVSLPSSNRLPLAIFCIAALVSEAIAFFVFFRARVLPADRLSSLSVIAAAAAAACTLAFLVAAVANAMRVW
jgi:hypothetical protein